jgi:hypothetical protein
MDMEREFRGEVNPATEYPHYSLDPTFRTFFSKDDIFSNFAYRRCGI